MHRLVVCACILALSHWCSVIAESDSQLVVHTPSGDIRGRIEPVVYGLSVCQFRGIPFAEPPIGKLRFSKPQPAQPWTGVRDATEFGPICRQINEAELAKMSNVEVSDDNSFSVSPQSEDCLTLNVYTPEHAKPGDNKAVMVWVHGGKFLAGSGRHYDPSVIVSLHDVIVVTINYRLGVFGFFNIPGATDIKGNYAMHDQVLALQWTKQHISSFGGNPDSVTIFGESAGAMSVSLHLLSPLSKGLFHRVIAQSGSSAGNSFYGRKVESGEQLYLFANATRCPRDDAMVECLRSKSDDELLEAQTKTATPHFTGVTELTVPVLDGEFLEDDTRKLLREGRVNKADVITGVTANEGVLFAMTIPNVSHDGVSRKAFERMVRHGLPLTRNPTRLTEDAIIHAYTDHSDPENSLKVRQKFVDLMTDVMFAAPAVYEASSLADHGVATYFYVFENLPDFFRYPAKWMASGHEMDLLYSFGMPLHSGHTWDVFKAVTSGWSAREVGFSMNIMKMWTDFAKYGDPNQSGNLPVAWPRYNSTAQPHLVIALEPRVGKKVHADKVAFFNEFLPKLVQVQQKKEQQKDKASKDEL